MTVQPLIEREPVRRAAISLIKALMREAGVRPVDMLEEKPLDAGGDPVGSRQLVAPVAALTPEQIRAGLVAAPAGVPGVVVGSAKPSGPVVVPPDVKVTRCPSGRDTRYAVDGPVVGEFTREWIRKRGGKR